MYMNPERLKTGLKYFKMKLDMLRNKKYSTGQTAAAQCVLGRT
jgi:hypothetical protein